MPTSTASASQANPFPGLRPYEERDSELFFGREDQIHDILCRLRNMRFLAVLGNSGCGKSSLIRAGVLPSLRDGFIGNWRIAVMRPGTSPLTNLAAVLNAPDVFGCRGVDAVLGGSLIRSALNRGNYALCDIIERAEVAPGTALLVVVDQFEELFRFHHQGANRDIIDEAHRFVQMLLTASAQQESSIYVILTMRSEFLGHCNPYTGLSEAINDGLYLVPRLSREQIRDAIEQPVRLSGGAISNRLINRVLNDLGEEQDQLPVLQHALARLWTLGQEAANHCAPSLEVELYESERIGGMRHALSRHVKEIMEQLDDGQHRLAEILFRNLTAVADNDELVRNPTTLKEISARASASVESVAEVIEKFRGEGKSFLMPPAPDALTATTVIDISHESLIRQWEELKNWTRDEHHTRGVRAMLLNESEQWDREGRNSPNEPDFLLQGLRLAEAVEWRFTHVEELNHESMTLAKQFLERSEKQKDDDLLLQQEAKNADQLRQANQQLTQQSSKLKYAVSAILVGTLFVAGFAILAWYQSELAQLERKKADHANQAAQQSARRSTAERLANASVLLPEQQAVSRLLLAAEAIHSTLVDNNNQQTSEGVQPNAIRAFEDAARFVTPAGIQTRVLGRHTRPATSVVSNWDPKKSGRRFLVTGSDDETVRVWDFDAQDPGRNYIELEGHGSAVSVIGLSRDDRWLVVGTVEGAVFLREFRDGHPQSVGRLIGRISGGVSDIEFSQGDSWCIVSSREGTVRVWNLDPPEKRFDLKGHRGAVLDVVSFEIEASDKSMSQWVATGGSDGNVFFWNLKSADSKPQYVLSNLQVVRDLAVSPRSDSVPTLLVGTDGGNVVECNLDFLSSAQPSESTQAIPSSSRQNSAIIEPNRFGLSAVSISFIDDQVFAVAGSDGQMYWGRSGTKTEAQSINDGQPPPTSSKSTPLNKVGSVFSTDSRTVDSSSCLLRISSNSGIHGDAAGHHWAAIVRGSGAIDLHQVSESLPVRNPLKLRGHDGDVRAATFIGQGDDRFVTVGIDGLVRLWDFSQENAIRHVNLEHIRSTAKEDKPANQPMPLTYAYSPDGDWTAAVQQEKSGGWKVILQSNMKDEPAIVLDPNLSTDQSPTKSNDSGSTNRDPIFSNQAWQISQSLVFGSDRDRKLRFVAAASARRVYIWPLGSEKAGSALSYPIQNESRRSEATQLAVSKNGRWLAAGLPAGQIWAWDLSESAGQKDPITAFASERAITSLAFSGDERFLAAGIDDRTLRIMTLSELTHSKSPTQIRDDKRADASRILSGFDSAIIEATLSNDGRYVCAVNRSNGVEVWDITLPKKLFDSQQQLTASASTSRLSQEPFVNDQRFEMSPDGRWLIATATNKNLVRWDLKASASSDAGTLPTRRELGISLGSEVVRFKFSPDSRCLVSIHRDGSLATWDLESTPGNFADAISPTSRHWGAVNIVGITFNDDNIQTRDEAGTFRRWALVGKTIPRDWVAFESAVAPVIGRNLNSQEQRDYFDLAGVPARKTFDGFDFEVNPAPGVADTQPASDKNLDVLAILRDLGKRVRIVDEGQSVPNPNGDEHTQGIIDDIEFQIDAIRQLGFGAIAEDAGRDLLNAYGQTLVTRAQFALQAGDVDKAVRFIDQATGREGTVPRALVPADFDWTFLRWTVQELTRQKDIEGARKVETLADRLTGKVESIKLEERVAEEVWNNAKTLAAANEFDRAEEALREAQRRNIVLPRLANEREVIQQYYWYRTIAESRLMLSGSSSEKDDMFKRFQESLAKAKAVPSPFSSLNMDELEADMLKEKQVKAFRTRLRFAGMEFANIESMFAKSAIHLEWVNFNVNASQIKTAADQGDINRAIKEYIRIKEKGLDLMMSAEELNSLVWMAVLSGRAAEISDAAELLIRKEPENPNIRDTYGVVIALSGRAKESIANFRYFGICTPSSANRSQRMQWIESLDQGKPASEVFSDDVLKKIREETLRRTPMSPHLTE